MESSVVSPKHTHLLSAKAYAIISALAMLIFPAVGSLYFALAAIWHLPSPEEVIGSIVAVDTFLGVLLKLGQISYDASGVKYDGTMDVVQNLDGKMVYTLNLKTDPQNLAEQDQVSFRVVKLQ